MDNISLSNPIICIDLKKHRIRIHKVTLHQMGDPDYIQLLVNPEKKNLIIRICSSGDRFSQKVRLQQMNGDYCYELYSTDLLKRMHSITSEWQEKQSYRIYGSYNQAIDAALFDLKDIELI